MSRDEEFRPRLGRIRSRGGKTAKRYLGKLYGSMEKMRPGVFARRSASRFTGERIGRGTGVAAAFASGAHRSSGASARRVTVKVRSVRLGGDGIAKARAHLYYLQRDGAGEDGAPAKLYGPEHDAVDGEAFLKEAENDRHQFRIIVSPEDGKDLADLTDYTRDLMGAVEKDLGTRLDWVAVNHFNTDHPHAHIVLRGKADDDRDLVIAKKYVTEGFRARAQEIATLELGPRREIDIARARMAETSHERLTSLDRDLMARADAGAVEIAPAKTAYDRFHNKLLFARLKTLQEMELAEQSEGRWRLAENLETSLKEMGRRGDIIRTMSAAMGPDVAPSRLRDFEDAAAPARLIGRVAGYGARDDAHVERIIAVEGADGNQWRVGAAFDDDAAPRKGAIVEVARTAPAPRQVDRTIAAIAARHEGVYSDALHAQADPRASAQFRLTHKRRLETLRRAGAAERLKDGTWRVPGDFLERAAAYDREKSPTQVRVLSWVALDRLPEARGAVFLDDALEGNDMPGAVSAGVGTEIKAAQAARRRWLLANNLAREKGARLAIDREALVRLGQAAVYDAGAAMVKRNDKNYVSAKDGEPVDGVYRGPADLPQGRYAIIEKSKEFTLVPWRAGLEQQRGRTISGTLTSGTFDWTPGRARKGPGRS